ncbi:Enamine deaminase RidA, house cleaning of reactive enamine intermediates, YjgF/YER057c/UK114 family [Sulfitobacter marinus]|uniref:Enamine deaminase RidA, house cleaning of reactive enamine intermediates, YjgF/YER057c/UK114 family n=1 Tax=Sulfitobacter marinus TaxID=394264 RepID=A0A1I6PD22_9RHOB|nr:Rid family hydrolase [Sulfitobacter marinus]SFS38086.1 Enamine deaminase RidA, house cleaning of reactive enamine intermediates, YjgF/YER057c/UK114 family [Sulfitobacter marinus]
MARDVVSPPELAQLIEATGFSPAVRAGDFLFLTGATGGDSEGVMPPDITRQVQNALGKALLIIDAAKGNADSIVEVTSYHIGLKYHFDQVNDVMRDMLGVPLPAWTAVEVADLRRPGALIELRIVAHLPTPKPARK